MNQQKPVRIMFAGTGGQGVLTAARLASDAFLALGHQVVSGQLHGMAQRGGSVQSTLIINGGTCPVVGESELDYLIGFEPVETVRALAFVGRHTTVFLNVTPVIPFVLAQRTVTRSPENQSYPDEAELVTAIKSVADSVYCVQATELAQREASAKSVNMVMLGCLLSGDNLPSSADDFWKQVKRQLPEKIVSSNSRAFLQGIELGKQFRS